jgi:hypothetical protein
VANKFQTGFDQPPLRGKDMTSVVDFVNDPGDILAAFKT